MTRRGPSAAAARGLSDAHSAVGSEPRLEWEPSERPVRSPRCKAELPVSEWASALSGSRPLPARARWSGLAISARRPASATTRAVDGRWGNDVLREGKEGRISCGLQHCSARAFHQRFRCSDQSGRRELVPCADHGALLRIVETARKRSVGKVSACPTARANRHDLKRPRRVCGSLTGFAHPSRCNATPGWRQTHH